MIPVVEGDPRSFDYPCVVFEQWGVVIFCDGDGNYEHLGNREADQPDFLPWASELKPGDSLLWPVKEMS